MAKGAGRRRRTPEPGRQSPEAEGGGSHQSRPSTSAGKPLLLPPRSASKTQGQKPQDVPFLVWNIRSPDLAGNLLECLPDNAGLSDEGRETMRKLLAKAREWMLDGSSSQTLGALLGEDLPDATELERAPLTDAASLKGLEQWLQSRRVQCQSIWPGMDAAQLADKWASEPAARWEYWRRQTIFDWLRDDGSGGVENTLLPVATPTIEQCCRKLDLGHADKNAKFLERSERARWLQPSKQSTAAAVGAGSFDFFKVLVWDLIVGKVLEAAAGADAVDALLKELQSVSSVDQLQSVRERVSGADVAVLTEVPKSGISDVGEFWEVRATTGAMHTLILARKARFSEPKPILFHDKDGEVDVRVIGCDLHQLPEQGQDGPDTTGRCLRVIGVHLPGSGVDRRLR